jgi:dTDP-4-amino-4,6-dideoxygalactose transaminase
MSVTTEKDIHLVDLAAERAQVGAEVEQAVSRVLASGRYILGPEVEALERDFAGVCGVKHGIGVASGTDALILGLRALGVEPGDHVVTSPFTFFASAASIDLIGAVPRLADVDPDTGLLDPAATAAAIDDKTTCIVPVHLYGQICDMQAIAALAESKGLTVLEDAAQAHGATRDGIASGKLGDAGIFSFYPTKNLGAAGEGGMVVTDDDGVAERMRQLRDGGSAAKYLHARVGTASRLQAIQGAVLRVKLPHLADWNRRRAANASRYTAAFAGSETVVPLRLDPGCVHAWHQYTVRIRGERPRDEVQAALAERRIFCGVHYPQPVHAQEAARPWGYRMGDFPAAEQLAREVLCLPVHPFLTDGDVERVAEALLELA